ADTLTASDTGAPRIDKTYYTTDGSVPTSSSSVYNSASKPVLTSDGQVIKYFSSDKAGNEEAVHSATAHIDTQPPVTTASGKNADSSDYTAGSWTEDRTSVAEGDR